MDKYDIDDLIKTIEFGSLKDVVLKLNDVNVSRLKGPGKTTLITYSAIFQRKEIFDYLMTVDKNINAVDESNKTALHHVCGEEFGDFSYYINKLVNSGASVESLDEDGQTPLFIACSNENLSSVKELIKLGADVHNRGELNCSPLVAPTSNEIVMLLVENGADVNSTDEDGDTALDIYANTELRQFLVAKGALSSKDLR